MQKLLFTYLCCLLGSCTTVATQVAKPKPHKEFINPEGLAKLSGYTQVVAVRGGRTVYVAGQINSLQCYR